MNKLRIVLVAVFVACGGGKPKGPEPLARADELMKERMKSGTGAAASHAPRPAAAAPGTPAATAPRGPVVPPAVGGDFVAT